MKKPFQLPADFLRQLHLASGTPSRYVPRPEPAGLSPAHTIQSHMLAQMVMAGLHLKEASYTNHPIAGLVQQTWDALADSSPGQVSEVRDILLTHRDCLDAIVAFIQRNAN